MTGARDSTYQQARSKNDRDAFGFQTGLHGPCSPGAKLLLQEVVMTGKSVLLCVCGLLSSVALGSPTPPNRLTIHEWGTFTVLQDEHGRAIAGINSDDEPLPPFVHNIRDRLIQSPTEVPAIYFKGAPQSLGEVYTRLETPVIYFYPPKGFNQPVSVNVEFKGGWLTQYYPDAKVDAPGLQSGQFRFSNLSDQTLGALTWNNVHLGTDASGPKTDERVWLAPRQVHAAGITAASGESEKYLFYRGVGHIQAPLRVSRIEGEDAFEVHGQFGSWASVPDGYTMGPLWLVDVRPDGACALRYVEQVSLPRSDQQTGPRIAANFSPDDYSKDLGRLRKTMHQALVQNGLFDEEAEAMLNTWEVSYFRRPGLRLFYLVPRAWTEHYLPLKVSESADISRAMVGRIELVTPRQRDLLRHIEQGPISTPDWLSDALERFGKGKDDAYREDFFKSLMDGKRTLGGEPIEIPPDYRAYLALGRFRNALVIDQQNRNPSDKLQQFINNYDLKPSTGG